MVEKRKRQLVQSLGINSLLLVKVSNWVIATQPWIMRGLAVLLLRTNSILLVWPSVQPLGVVFIVQIESVKLSLRLIWFKIGRRHSPVWNNFLGIAASDLRVWKKRAPRNPPGEARETDMCVTHYVVHGTHVTQSHQAFRETSFKHFWGGDFFNKLFYCVFIIMASCYK